MWGQPAGVTPTQGKDTKSIRNPTVGPGLGEWGVGAGATVLLGLIITTAAVIIV